MLPGAPNLGARPLLPGTGDPLGPGGSRGPAIKFKTCGQGRDLASLRLFRYLGLAAVESDLDWVLPIGQSTMAAMELRT